MAKNFIERWFTDPDNNCSFVYNMSTGQIRCSECNSTWCNHIKKAVVNAWDQAAVWDKPENEMPSDLVFFIPMFPADSLWTEVTLIPVEGSVPRYEVQWDNPLRKIKNHFETICYINPGEGRAVIRSTLYEYMLADPKRLKECIAEHHGYAAQKRWEQDAKGNKHHAQLWSVYTKGECLYCAQILSQTDDIVPPRQGSGVFNG